MNPYTHKHGQRTIIRLYFQDDSINKVRTSSRRYTPPLRFGDNFGWSGREGARVVDHKLLKSETYDEKR